ncbi:IS30 family transposase [Streptomyces sp. TX20-6-3]|uniref:IS30 family transposase n=1 Tax=Streptomyces sp. TX20-6-3 TaxID=3028705 RepID=UPI0029A0C0DA|nr:IS30 family transposase [Streptomyces sp. TX20-6-3]MDX2565268.1 IS30 family transposase [Streptomyces sp. TX20-6-3]
MMGVLMARVGRKRRLDIEAEYWRLLQSGVGTVEACKLVGIGRKTGYRWRSENGGLPPERVAESVHSGRYLSLLERKRIATLRERGLGIREIAERLERSPSTVSRELRRNVLEHDKGVYDADLAHHRSRQRAERPRRPKLKPDAELRAVVQAKLDLEWSPEQIAAHLRALWPNRPERHLCHETVYRALCQGAKGVLSRTLTKKLRTGRPLRRQRRRADQRAPRFAVPATLIDERPAVVELRERAGDWEGDLITGRSNRTAIATLVDRRTRFVRLVALPDGHGADQVHARLTAALRDVPGTARMTLTWDQGSEMACHDRLAPLFRDGVFVAHRGSPWQRGTNENTNGLLRQYLPKGSDLSVHTADDLRAIEDRLNNRPRKTLGWQTPAELFAAALTA